MFNLSDLPLAMNIANPKIVSGIRDYFRSMVFIFQVLLINWSSLQICGDLIEDISDRWSKN